MTVAVPSTKLGGRDGIFLLLVLVEFDVVVTVLRPGSLVEGDGHFRRPGDPQLHHFVRVRQVRVLGFEGDCLLQHNLFHGGRGLLDSRGGDALDEGGYGFD